MNQMVDKIITAIRSLPEKDRILIAIDGRCASGKTTLADTLSRELGGTVFHMDDFFLRPKQRTVDRLNTPGGNVDYERFYDEVVFPLMQGDEIISYRPYDCQTQSLLSEICVRPEPCVLIEGAYCCHPYLKDAYDLKVFLTVSYEEQLRRIIRREGETKVKIFREKWIPMEEKYFAQCHVREESDLSFDNSIIDHIDDKESEKNYAK